MSGPRTLRTGEPSAQTHEGVPEIRVLEAFPQESEARPRGPVVSLTQREHEVLCLLGEGLSNKMIGRRLDISSGTVKVHVGNILRKLAVSSRLHAVIVARQRGLVHEHAGLGPKVIVARRPRET